MSKRKLSEDVADSLGMPQLPARLRPLVDELIQLGPSYLPALFHYLVEQTANDSRWTEVIQDALADMHPAAVAEPDDLSDGLIYKVKITLRGVRPAIFREVEVPNITLGELHEVIQTAMGWHNGHLHCFTIDREQYGPLNEDMSYDAWQDEESLSLGELVKMDQRKFTYEYDFGDSWEHDILISKPKPPQAGVVYPRVVKGELACPPEDCGGIWGYLQICEILKKSKTEWTKNEKERMEWLENYDPQEFSADETTKELQKLLAPITKPKTSRPKSR